MGRSSSVTFRRVAQIIGGEVAAQVFESEIAERAVEVAGVFALDGTQLATTDGTFDSVDMTPLMGQIKDAIVTHNHPGDQRDTGIDPAYSSFSNGDITVAMRGDVYQMRAVTPEATFVMTRPRGGWPDAREVIAARREIGTRYKEEAKARAAAANPGGYTMGDLQRAGMSRYQHDVNNDLFRRFDIPYARTPRTR